MKGLEYIAGEFHALFEEGVKEYVSKQKCALWPTGSCSYPQAMIEVYDDDLDNPREWSIASLVSDRLEAVMRGGMAESERIEMHLLAKEFRELADMIEDKVKA